MYKKLAQEAKDRHEKARFVHSNRKQKDVDSFLAAERAAEKVLATEMSVAKAKEKWLATRQRAVEKANKKQDDQLALATSTDRGTLRSRLVI